MSTGPMVAVILAGGSGKRFWPLSVADEPKQFLKIEGDQTLFIRNDEVEASWQFTDSIRSAWRETGKPELLQYAPDSWGPAQADGLFENPYMRWQAV